MKSLSSIFKKKKKQEQELSEWEKRIAESAKQEYVTPQDLAGSIRGAVSLRWLKIPKRLLNIRWLLGFERKLSSLFTLIYLVLSIVSFPNPISIFLFLSAYLHFRYVYRTRLIRVWRDKDKPDTG